MIRSSWTEELDKIRVSNDGAIGRSDNDFHRTGWSATGDVLLGTVLPGTRPVAQWLLLSWLLSTGHVDSRVFLADKREQQVKETFTRLFTAGTINFQERKMTPCTIIIDLEPTVIDQIRNGPYRRLFDPESLISGKEDASNNFAAGYYSVGREMIDLAVHRVARIWDQCSKPTGFIVFR